MAPLKYQRMACLGVVEKYSSAVNKELLENLSTSMGTLARKLDGTMSGAEKTRMHNDAIAQAYCSTEGGCLTLYQKGSILKYMTMRSKWLYLVCIGAKTSLLRSR